MQMTELCTARWRAANQLSNKPNANYTSTYAVHNSKENAPNTNNNALTGQYSQLKVSTFWE